MTNYRMEMCEKCDKPQFKVCFDCGEPIVFEAHEADGQTRFTCSAMNFHLKIWTAPHDELEEGVRFV